MWGEGCFELMMSTWNKTGGVPQFVLIEINGDILLFWLDALCCAEPVKPESGQNPTTQTKVLLDSPKNQPEICSRTNNRQAMLGNILDWFVLGEGCFESMMSTWINSGGESPDLFKVKSMVKSCCFDSMLCAVLNRWNLRVASTLQHRRRSYSILQSINQKFVDGQIIGKQSLWEWFELGEMGGERIL